MTPPPIPVRSGLRRFTRFVWGPWLFALVASSSAQEQLPNPNFDIGDAVPTGWRLEGRGAYRERLAGLPERDGWIAVEGRGEDSAVWRTEPLALVPGGLYRFAFHGRRLPGASQGTAVSGLGRVNRDFPLDESWQPQRFVLSVPLDGAADYARLGQWHVTGTLEFDQVSLVPVLATHAQFADGIELGQGESLEPGRYRFHADLGWTGANYHRPLATNRAGFNSNRWLFSPGAEVVYRHQLGRLTQTGARLRLNLNHHLGGALRVEVRRDAQGWLELGRFDARQRAGVLDLPASLFPANAIEVRLATSDADAAFQVDTYEYEATLPTRPLEAEGATWFFEVQQQHPDLGVALTRFRPADDDGQCRVDLVLTNRSSAPLSLLADLWREGRGSIPGKMRLVRLDGGATLALNLTCTPDQTGTIALGLIVADPGGTKVFRARTEWQVGFLHDRSYGQGLAGPAGLAVWWCESGWKIGRERAAPEPPRREPAPVALSAARGESEAVQVVLRPAGPCTLRGVAWDEFRHPQGHRATFGLTVREVAYVRVTRPTDASGVPGWYPDPLPPLATPWVLTPHQNQPLWIAVQVPRDAPPGEYRGRLTLDTTLGAVRVPLAVRVYDFALPEETHLRSALGLGADAINRYHRLTNRADQEAVFAKYLANFAAHRISPYSFYDYAPMDVRFVGEGAARRAQVDFTRFDAAAARWLDGARFNTFQLPLRGMGGGTFHSRHLGQLEGHPEGTPEFARLFRDYLGQVETHLRDRGWLGQAFTYWFDEPDPKDYDFVVAGMQRLKNAAPGVRRMLTEQPEPALLGHVDIWCGLTPEWTREKVQARRAAGEEVWWYICTAPKAPYLTEFIDHPGTELRLWPWQSWQYGVTGILVWATLYWTSPCAYPEPQLQDPWRDPMSWVSGYDTPVGTRNPWGNGDGRFLYPPRRDPNAAAAPNLDGPIDSVRWENLRDGMEDYEYLWLLQQAVERAASNPAHAAPVREARALLAVPEEISADLTHFTTDPRVILRHRDRIARLLEHLTAPTPR